MANNREVGMPFGTRFWNEAMESSGNDICCQGKEFQGFKPCCHYRWYPWAFKMPAGWGQWNEWNDCTLGRRVRFRPCNGLKGQCKVTQTHLLTYLSDVWASLVLFFRHFGERQKQKLPGNKTKPATDLSADLLIDQLDR